MNRKLFFIILLVILIFVITFVYSNILSERRQNETNEHFLTNLGISEGRSKILLMFAHPDDETMFFTPTLLALKEGGADIHFLCLSSGGHKNLGTKRIEEMYDVASSLGVSNDRVKIGKFLDKPGLKWSHLDVANTLNKYVRKWNIDSVITFDHRGVSGHSNHVSCYDAVSYYMTQNQNVDFYVLNSGEKKTRYLGALGNHRKGGNSRTAVSNSAKKAWTLMKNHHSQNTWWRKLHIALSSHTYVNNLTKL